MLKLLLFLTYLNAAFGIPLHDFTGDAVYTGSDDGCASTLTFTGSFPFFGVNYDEATPAVNGVVGFTQCISGYTPSPFPIADSPVIAPYWGDADTRCEDCFVYTRVRQGPSPIDSFGGITAVEYFQVTWSNVGYYSQNTDRKNTFQMITATDRSTTITCFIYPNDEETGNPNGGLDWTTGDLSGGSGGLGGIPAQVGFDAGDGVNFLTLVESQTDAVRSLDGVLGTPPATPATSVGFGIGQYCYRVDTSFEPLCPPGTTVVGGSCVAQACEQQITCASYNLVVDQNCEAEIDDFTTNIQSNCETAEYAQEPQSGEFRTLGSYTTTETVTNEYGASESCNGILTVSDIQNPILVCPIETTTFTTDLGSCSSAQDVSPLYSASDNCAVGSTSDDAPAAFPLGPSSVTAVARDSSGNSNSCSFNVIVSDAESPDIQCPAVDTAFTTDLGSCSRAQDVSSLYSASDNCAVGSTSDDAPAAFPLGPSSVTAVARDTSGNSNSCSFNVIVSDAESPDIQCPAVDTTFTTDLGSCSSAQDVSSSYSASDNCAVGSTSDDAPAAFPLGPSSVTAVARDTSGNSNSCSFNVIVSDAESPDIQCPTVGTAFTTDPGSCSSAQDVSSLYSASDNCAVGSTSDDAPAAFPLGPSSVTAVARDSSGNSNSCSFNVIVSDAESPDIQCPAVDTTFTTDLGSCSSAQDVSSLYSASDNCAVGSTSDDAPAAFPLGPSSVTAVARDTSGNSNSCSFNVIVSDAESPDIQCPTVGTAFTTDPGSCSSAQDVSSLYSASDNCAVGSTSDDAPAAFPLGPSSVTAVARDTSGNSNSCSFNVIVSDAESPDIQCPAVDTTFTTDLGSCSSAQDVSSLYSASDNCAVGSTSDDAPAAFPLGPSSVTAVARDTSGNSNSCSFNVIVSDAESPDIQCPAVDTTFTTDLGSCSSAQDVSSLYSASDNCAVGSTSDDAPAAFPLGPSSVTAVARDTSGNSNSCSFNVIVSDAESPDIQCPTVGTTFTTDLGSCYRAQDVSSLYSASDNCAVGSTSDDAPAAFPLGPSSVTAVARDTSGNSNSCSFNVIVSDAESPDIQCPAVDTTFTTDLGSCSSAQDVSSLYSASDNCAVGSTWDNAPAAFPLGPSSITAIVTDTSGNSNSCSFNVIVSDAESPDIQCPAVDTTFTTDLGSCSSAQDVSSLYSASDNCAVGSTSDDAPAAFSHGSSVVTAVARDSSGNSNSCSFNVIVSDAESPDIQCPTEDTAFTTDPGSCSSAQDVSSFYSASDNCAVGSTSDDAPAAFPQGPSSVTAVARDTSGNSNSCSFNVIVSDAESPVLTCPSDIITLFTDSGRCVNSEDISKFYSASDNCQVELISSDAPLNLLKGRTTVNAEASDPSGNSGACSFEIEVKDNELPIIQCPNNVITIPTDIGVCSSIRSASLYYTATDNCAIDTLSDNSPLVMQKGTTSVTATVTDESGNSDFCLFDIVVEDREPPIIKCPRDIEVGVFEGIESIVVEWEDIEIYDNCAIISSSLSIPSGSEFQFGITDVEMSASDGVNVSTCKFQVIVKNRVVNSFSANSIEYDGVRNNYDFEYIQEAEMKETASSAPFLQNFCRIFYLLVAMLVLSLI